MQLIILHVQIIQLISVDFLIARDIQVKLATFRRTKGRINFIENAPLHIL